MNVDSGRLQVIVRTALALIEISVSRALAITRVCDTYGTHAPQSPYLCQQAFDTHHAKVSSMLSRCC